VIETILKKVIAMILIAWKNQTVQKIIVLNFVKLT